MAMEAYKAGWGINVNNAVMIRADVAYAASELSKHLLNPGPRHLAAVNHALLYLYGRRFLAIQYGGEHSEEQFLLIAGDASFADDQETRRSSQGYIFNHDYILAFWYLYKHLHVAFFSTHANASQNHCFK
jgi:hypothetical protein